MRARNGFTLLEVLLVIILIGFLAAMFVPKGLELDNATRARRTRQTIDEIAQAIAGPPTRFDKTGNPIFAGFTADMGSLPKLYYGTFIWDDAGKRWDYLPFGPGSPARSYLIIDGNAGYADPQKLCDPSVVRSLKEFTDTVRRLQPIALWDNNSQLGLSPIGAWQGPYINRPYDQLPRNADSFNFDAPFGSLDSVPASERSEKLEYALLQTDDRLADAWGRSLIFWPRWDPSTQTAEFWIISQGPDADCEWRGERDPEGKEYFGYSSSFPKNMDNIVRVIKHNEWYEHNVGRKIEQTRRKLEDIRGALVGPPNARDASGNRTISGYIADLGKLPDVRRDTPRELWTRDLDMDGIVSASENIELPLYSDGYGWRGPYYIDLAGDPPNERIVDSWNRPIGFRPVNGVDLRIYSLGRTDSDADDIEVMLYAAEWQGVLTDITQQIIQEVCSAVVRTSGGGDLRGNPLVGGFVGDMGRLPCLYKWANPQEGWSYRFSWDFVLGTIKSEHWNGTQWSDSSEPFAAQSVSPRELWTSDTIGDGLDQQNDLPTYADGIGWRGGYLSAPPGSGSSDVLRDAWGRPLRFTIDATGLHVWSQGPDPNKSDDDMNATVFHSTWRRDTDVGGEIHFQVSGTATGAFVASVAYALPDAPEQPLIVENSIPGESKVSLKRIPAGARVLVVWDDARPETKKRAAFVVDTNGDPDRGSQTDPLKFEF